MTLFSALSAVQKQTLLHYFPCYHYICLEIICIVGQKVLYKKGDLYIVLYIIYI